jgi:hypothetical protein
MLDPETVSESIRTLTSQLDDWEIKRQSLFSELKASMAIQELWPDAFEHGPASVRIEGSHINGFKLCIRNFVEEKSFDLSEIPVELACRPHIKKALKDILNKPCGPSDAKKQAEALLNELWKKGL